MDKTSLPAALANDYVRIVDDRAFDEMAAIMWPDFTQKGPGFGAESLEQFIQNLEILRNYSATFHLLGGQFGQWEGDRYSGETYCVASHIYAKDGVDRKLDMAIRYKELIELRNGEGKYLRRDLDVIWTDDRELGVPPA